MPAFSVQIPASGKQITATKSKAELLKGIICTTAITLFLSIPATSKSADIPLFDGNMRFSVNVESMQEQRFHRIIRQHYDFSCGSAALATLLTWHLDTPTDEQTALKAMFDGGDQEKIRNEGFSMLDMKRYAESIGMQADGYRIPLEKFSTVKIPAIVLINSNGYMHFVVIKGITETKILLGDPAAGIKTVDRSTFEKEWNGIVFIIQKPLAGDKKPQYTFNAIADWRGKQRLPSRYLVETDALAGFTVNNVFTPNYYK